MSPSKDLALHRSVWYHEDMFAPDQTKALVARRGVPVLAAVIVLALGHTLVDFYGTTITPLLPRFQELWRLSSVSLGWLAAATSLTGSLLQPVLGLYLDKRGTSALAAAAVLWTGATVLLLDRLPSYAALFVLATVTILGSAVYHPLGAALTLRVSPPGRRGFNMSLFMNIGTLGWAGAPFLVTWYVTAFGLRSLAWLIIPGLLEAVALGTLGLSLVRTSTPLARSAGSAPPATPAPSAAPAGAASSGLPDLATAGPSPVPEPPLASREVRTRGVLFLLTATILRSWVATGIQTYLPVYLVQQGHSLTFAGGALTTFMLSGTLAGFFIGWLSDRTERRTLYAGTLALAAAGLWWFLRAPAAWSPVASALTGAALLGSVPLTVVMIQEMHPHRTGTGSGLVIGFAGGLGGLLVLASGALADWLGLRAALAWLVPTLPLAALEALAIPAAACRRPRRESQPAGALAP
ncbi:MAG: MFS transporter [Firmicutes bacterium]|nr:MFS transporter [Bacillota bacterium]